MNLIEALCSQISIILPTIHHDWPSWVTVPRGAACIVKARSVALARWSFKRLGLKIIGWKKSIGFHRSHQLTKMCRCLLGFFECAIWHQAVLHRSVTPQASHGGTCDAPRQVSELWRVFISDHWGYDISSGFALSLRKDLRTRMFLAVRAQCSGSSCAVLSKHVIWNQFNL